MILMDEMIPMKLYSNKQRAYLPFDPVNKRKGALVTLLTQSIDDSIELMQKPFFHNPSYFISYYMDRNVKRYLSRDGKITIEGEEEDPDETIQEAVMRKIPKNSPVITCYGNSNDFRLLDRYFTKKAFDKWYDFFRIRKQNRIYPAVYGFNSLNDMFKAVGQTAIEKHGQIICNSYNSATEIVLLNNSQYNLVNSDGPYDMYCNAAIITYVVHVGFPKATFELANNIATHLSGQDKYLYEKNNYQSDDRIGMALLIGKYHEKYGQAGMIKLARNGNYYDLVQFGGAEFIKRIAGGISKAVKKESAVLESDGTHFDSIRVYNSMSSKDRDFISRDNRFQQWSTNNECIYRHVEKEGLMDVYGFVECYNDLPGSASVVIGVDPKHRGEGVATKMMEQLLREFPKENPKIDCLIWRADAKNKKSQNLAQKFGFKLIRESSVQNVYRKWIKNEDKDFSFIPDDVLDEESLVKWMRKKFEIDTSYTTDKTKIRSIDDIVHSRKISNLESGLVIYTALKKMGLNCAITLFCEHGQNSIGDVYPMVLHTYTDDWSITYIIDPFDKNLKSGIARISKFDQYFPYGEKLHTEGRWGDAMTKPHVFTYNPYDEELKAGNNVYKDIIKVQNLTESAILEFTVKNKLSPPGTPIEHKPHMSLSSLKKIQINDDVIKKYSPYMKGLHHVATTANCTGYLWIDPREVYSATNINKPVCYYNLRRKKDENSDSGYICWIQGIEVNKDYEGRGLAKQMLDLAIKEGATNLAVNKDNEVAIRLYRSKGFKPYVTNGDMINMQLPIKHETVYLSPNDRGTMMFEGQLFVFTEELSQASYNTKLRQYLYKDRIRSIGQQMEIFNQVKARCPVIRKTFTNPQMYKGLNCFIDLSYYNSLFLKNNQTVRDIAIQFYWEYLNRMLEGTDPYFRDNYVKNTIFVPVTKNAWPVKPDSYVYDWKQNLNPISLIFRMIRRNPTALLSAWSKYNFIFVGANGYFRVDFSRFELKNLVRFKRNLEKLYNGESIEMDEEEDGYGSNAMDGGTVSDTSSTAGITALVVDKIEKSSGIEVNNISAAVNNSKQKIEDVPVLGQTSTIPIMKIQTSKIHTPADNVGIALLVPDDNSALEAIKKNRSLITTTMMDYYSK